MGHDASYPGVEVLPDEKGSIVVTTYGHWIRGEDPFILTTRFSMKELDAHAEKGSGLLLEGNSVRVRR